MSRCGFFGFSQGEFKGVSSSGGNCSTVVCRLPSDKTSVVGAVTVISICCRSGLVTGLKSSTSCSEAAVKVYWVYGFDGASHSSSIESLSGYSSTSGVTMSCCVIGPFITCLLTGRWVGPSVTYGMLFSFSKWTELL